MSVVLVDSNVLLDVLTENPIWCARSENALVECAEHSTLAINPISSAEI